VPLFAAFGDGGPCSRCDKRLASFRVNEFTGERFADDDPEYASDAADDFELDLGDLEPTDPKKIPKDQGDSGSAEPPEGGD
jgi:hypothetical protein